jgi:hypothetical protein
MDIFYSLNSFRIFLNNVRHKGARECPTELREHALTHRVGNVTTQSYERGAQFEKRRAMMQDWAKFMHASPNLGNNVTQLKRRLQTEYVVRLHQFI